MNGKQGMHVYTADVNSKKNPIDIPKEIENIISSTKSLRKSILGKKFP